MLINLLKKTIEAIIINIGTERKKGIKKKKILIWKSMNIKCVKQREVLKRSKKDRIRIK